MKQTMIALFLMLYLLSSGAAADPQSFPRELIGSHDGAMGQTGSAAEDGSILFNENDCVLGGLEFKPDGTLIVPFAQKGDEFKRLLFKRIEKYIPRAMTAWKPLKIGEDEYTALLSRHGKVFRVLVKLHRRNRAVSGIQWICAEPMKAEHQPGSDPDKPGGSG